MVYNKNTYLIFSTSEIDKIDFNAVLESSPDTLRYTNDESKTFVKWEGDTPEFAALLETAEQPMSHEQMLNKIAKPEWFPLMEDEDGSGS